MNETPFFRFHEINKAPEPAGIYAWYYRLELSEKDVETCIAEANALPVESRRETLEAFLELRLFRYFKEQPYHVALSGRLKPTYEGEIANRSRVSQSLIDRLSADPARLRSLRGLLQAAMPFFASPLYIGVAKSLRRRLLQHKALIEKFLNSRASGSSLPVPETDEEELVRDHSFAEEVSLTRGFLASNLVVFALSCPVDEGVRIDLENVLNRIYFPLCGRN